MSKAVLVMERPLYCEECPFCDEAENCLAMDAYCIDVDIRSYTPDWCPLVPLPTRQKPPVTMNLF